ncbi:MAG: flagellar motor protein MotB [Alphaproteobacteria bacterium]
MPPSNKSPGDKVAPLIIKKKKRSNKHEVQHSSAWKIAYADFVTAMMAFFLLMWLINTMSNEQKKGISNYFDPIGVSEAASGAGGVLGGQTIMSDGVMQDVTATPQAGPPVGAQGDVADAQNQSPSGKQVTEKEEEAEFEEVQKKIREQVEQNPELKELAENLVMDVTDEGLRIQLVDRYKKPMFATASSLLYTDALKLLSLVGQSIISVPNKITISGHTDAFRYSKSSGYSNWELSADRANSARRTLETIVGPGKIAQISGKAHTEPFVAANPNDPANRRISIVLVRRAGGGKKKETSGAAAEKKAEPAQAGNEPEKAKSESERKQEKPASPRSDPTRLFQ